MNYRYIAAFLASSLLPSFSSAQVVRFDTSVGNFDLMLNPTNDPRLQGHVDNLLAYVEARLYHCTVINRAAEDFVLQMGGFETKTLVVPSTVDGFMRIDRFDPITGVPAAQTGLSNTRGTVAMALPGDGMGGTNRNGGTSEFFVNIGDNSFLDPDFSVFAVVPDLTTIDTIMSLPNVNLTANPDFGDNSLAFSDVPLQENGNLVFIQRAFVVEDTLAIAAARSAALDLLFNPAVLPQTSASNSLLLQSTSGSSQGNSSPVVSVPEPSVLLLSLVGLAGFASGIRR